MAASSAGTNTYFSWILLSAFLIDEVREILLLGTVSGLEYKLKRCTNKECCKQCRHVIFKGTMTKWPVQKLAQGTTQKLLQHHDATDI